MNLRFILTFAWYYGFKVIKRGPSYIIASLTTPLALLFVVYILTSGELVKFAVVGGMITLVASIGIQSAGDAAFMRLQLRLQDLYVASRVSPTDYMLALTLSFLVFSIPGIIVYIGLGYLYHLYNIVDSLVMFSLILMLVFATSAISFIISSLVKHVRNVWGIVSVLSIVMTVIPPTFYPYTDIISRPNGYIIIYLMSFSPATPAAILAQFAFGLQPIVYTTLYTMIGILVAETVIYFTIARYLTRWREA
ncbi:MAG: ABC transporter permease [Thermoplasmataceae archaeon]